LSNFGDIDTFLKQREATFVSAFRVNELARTLLVEIPLDLVRSKAGRGVTSKRQLIYLKRGLEVRFGLTVLVSFRQSQELNNLEVGLNAVLHKKFAGIVLDSYLSFPQGDSALAWVFLAVQSESATEHNIRDHVVNFLAQAGVTCGDVELVGPIKPEPSIAAMLRSIKKLAPVDLTTLEADIQRRGMQSSSMRWLASKLDWARKRGLVIRNTNGSYVLTASGLALVPHTRSRSSSDVERMLSLAKRREW